MSFYKENKLLITLLIAIVAVGIVSIGMVSAQMSITKSKSTDAKYWEIPKAESPNIMARSPAPTRRGAQLGHVDPIVIERDRQSRAGIPSSKDVYNLPGTFTGLGSDQLPENIKRKIQEGNLVPTTPFAEIYDPDSPWDFQGRPGRLGERKKEKMAQYYEALEKGELQTVDPMPEPSETPDHVTPTEVKPQDVDIESLRQAFSRFMRTIASARREAEATRTTAPMEGVLEDELSE